MDKVEAALEQNDLAQLRAMGHHIKLPAVLMGAVASPICAGRWKLTRMI